jgi:hypothetical protein
MQFVKPMLFSEARDKLGQKSNIGAKLNSEQWSEVPVALRERAFFSSQVENTRFLQRSRDMLTDWLGGAKETVIDPYGREQTALSSSRQEFVRQMQAFAIAEGMGAIDGDSRSSSLQDISAQKRLELIFDTNTRAAQDFGYWKQGQDPDVLDEFPAQRFIRVIDVEDPRAWHTRFEGEVHLKSDLDFWLAVNEDFGVPWGPWGWGCGHDVEDVDRDEAEQLGLIRPGERAVPVEKDLNDRLQASTRNLDPDLRAKLKEQFGAQIDIEGDAVRWSGSTAAPAVDEAPSPNPPDGLVREGADQDTRGARGSQSAPVSAALENKISNPAARGRVNEALRIIDSVHDDGVLPKITIDGKVKGALGEYSPKGGRIGIWREGTHPELTTLHEVGHLLDHHGIGGGSFATVAADPRLAEWLAVVQSSNAFAELQRGYSALGGSRMYSYLMKPQELFARSYAQYIAESSADGTLLQQLDALRASAPGRQWTTEDFAPIRAALDKLFKELDWL